MHSALSKNLESAVLELVGNGALKDRLYAAWCKHLDGIDLQDLPGETQEDYAAMVRVMHGARALPGDSVVRASIRKFSNEEAARYAALVLRVWRLRVQELAATPRAPARSAASAPAEATPLAALLTLESSTRIGARMGGRSKQASRS
jgi:hypothetical protein